MTLGSELCTQCGLCCNGALFKTGTLDLAETGIAEKLGLKLVAGDLPRFAIPCPVLDGCSCSIYPLRPQVCRRYKCQLLQDVEGGLTDIAAAAQRVREARSLLAEVERKLPAGTTLPEARDTLLVRDGEAQVEPAMLPLKLALTALCLYLDRHFKRHGEARFLSLEPMGSPEDALEMK